MLAHRRLSGALACPTKWRNLLLLSSRVADLALDARLCEGVTGILACLPFVWSRHPSAPRLVLDRVLGLHSGTPNLAGDVLIWGSTRVLATGRVRAR